MMKVVSILPDRCDWQWCGNRCNRWWVAAHNCDNLISVHLQSWMEANNNIVGEHSLGILFRSTSFERELDLVAQVAFTDDLASTVTVEVRVGDAVKLFIEFHIHLLKRETQFSDIFAQKRI